MLLRGRLQRVGNGRLYECGARQDASGPVNLGLIDRLIRARLTMLGNLRYAALCIKLPTDTSEPNLGYYRSSQSIVFVECADITMHQHR